ncbi:uncharacterized protein LOC135847758 [Planococcus citri]|uniref:uncharacterized protein LOC135847758 n=1 Tax=Planococcus citri TaxID=170843 RepID=UPI0031F73481
MYIQFLLISILLHVKCCHCTLAGKFYLNRGPQDFTPRSNFIQATTLGKGTPPNFKQLTKCTTFIDKTKMIEDFFTYDKNHHHTITYPRRFGKSTNLDMIKRFAQIPIDPTTGKMENIAKTENSKLFKDQKLAIHENEEIFETHFGKYHVIRITVRNTRVRTFEELLDHIRTELVICFLDYVWIYIELEKQMHHLEMDSNKRSSIKQQYHLMDKVFQHNVTEEEITLVLQLLCELVSDIASEKIVLLIDNLDAPIMNAMAMNFSIQRTYDLIYQMLHNVFVNQPDRIEYSMITGTSYGILSSLTSHLKFFTNHRFLDDHLFADSCGFSEQEVEKLFKRHRISDEERVDVKRNFFGYTTRSNKLNFYNTYTIVQFFNERTIQPPASDEILPNYWAETGSILENTNFLTIASIRNSITQLICREQIQIQMDNSISNFSIVKQLEELQKIARGDYESFSELHIDLFFDHFFDQGYLSYASKPDHYRIPNYEIIQRFQSQLKLYHDKKFPKLKTEFVARNLSTVLHLEYPSALQLAELEISFNQLFDIIDRENLPSYQFVRNQWEFVYLIYWACGNFVQYFHKIETGVELKPVGNGTESAYAHLMFWSKGQRLILLLQTVSNQDFIAALDQIQGYVPVNQQSDVVKYFGININENFTIEVGDGSNHGVLKLKPGETGFDFAAGYSIFKHGN